jgi:hypothetical protein
VEGRVRERGREEGREGEIIKRKKMENVFVHSSVNEACAFPACLVEFFSVGH